MEKGMKDCNELQIRTKDIERILWPEILNWMRWGWQRDDAPASYKCVLGNLYIRQRVPEGDERYDPYFRPRAEANSIKAHAFERLVIGLPERHRRAFVMYRLNKAADNGKIVEIESLQHMSRLLGVQNRMRQLIVSEAHNMLFNLWKAENLKKKALIV